MSESIKMEDIVEKTESTSDTVEQVETETKVEVETEQGPLKTELERIQKQSKYTEAEKAEHSLKKNAEKAKELGIDVSKVLGFSSNDPDEDNTPLTVGAWKKMQQETAAKTAIQQAEEIPNETERELVKHHLQNTIKSTGNPLEDLKLARALVNAVKNSQIIEETTRKVVAKTHSSASGVDLKRDLAPQFTPEERQMMGSPFNLSEKEILAAREGKKFTFRKN